METDAVVKTGADTLIKYGSATLGLATGSFVANKIPVPAVGPEWLQNILKKAGPGLVVMIIAYLAASKFKNNEKVEAGAIGMGLAGLANIIKNVAPSLAQYIPLNGLGAAAMQQTIDLPQTGSDTYGMLNGMGTMPMDAYGLLN